MSLLSGGVEFDTRWLSCSARAAGKKDQAFVQVTGTARMGRLAFYVARSLVKPERLGDQPVDAKLKVLLLEERDAQAVVAVPGEPVSFGPKILVPTNLLQE